MPGADGLFMRPLLSVFGIMLKEIYKVLLEILGILAYKCFVSLQVDNSGVELNKGSTYFCSCKNYLHQKCIFFNDFI